MLSEDEGLLSTRTSPFSDFGASCAPKIVATHASARKRRLNKRCIDEDRCVKMCREDCVYVCGVSVSDIGK